MEILGKIFGSTARVKLLRLFLFNPDNIYKPADISRHTKVAKSTAQREISTLNRAGFIKRRSFYKDVVRKKGNKRVMKKKRTYGWMLDTKFPYLYALQQFLINAAPFNDRDIAQKLRGAGNFKLIVVAGVFMQNLDSRLDILIVGERIRKSQLEAAIKSMEAELGRELRYAVFNVNDFRYRLGVYDKLIRDVFDYPHRNIVDRIGIEFNARSETSVAAVH